MNTLKDIRDKYKISKEEAITILGKSGSTIDRYDKEPISNLSVDQLINLHREKQIPYNTLLGETVFTPNNIDNIESNINILDNNNEYIRETIINTTQEVLAENEDIKSAIIKQVILLFKDKKYKDEIRQFIIDNINTSIKDLKQ